MKIPTFIVPNAGRLGYPASKPYPRELPTLDGWLNLGEP